MKNTTRIASIAVLLTASTLTGFAEQRAGSFNAGQELRQAPQVEQTGAISNQTKETGRTAAALRSDSPKQGGLHVDHSPMGDFMASIWTGIDGR